MATRPDDPVDATSRARPDEVKVTHVHMDLRVDFDTKTLIGSATHTATVQKDGVTDIVFDARDLRLKTAKIDGTPTHYTLTDEHAALGAAVNVPIPEDKRVKGSEVTVVIEYETTEHSEAVQWLRPEQTAGGKHPYLFTQCQAIHARSLLPCQDSPSVKVTYSANITVKYERAPLTVVMSAVQKGSVRSQFGTRQFSFEQKIAIPSYLIALAVGNLESREIGPRSQVWSEPEMVEAGAYEFAETETFLKTAESLLGPYVWGRYDILLLPPSFPYGGMENPCLTFVTPTLLAGDRSLADVVIHEIMHSWTGNLVTSRTWSHFWLNEGFTMYVQRRVVARLRGEEAAELDATIGVQGLSETVAGYGEEHAFTCLCPRLVGVDPDDAFSRIPYEKGFNFLYYLMTVIGSKEAFDIFLAAYIKEFAHQSITSDDFKQFFLHYFEGKVTKQPLSAIDWNAWLCTPGMGPYKNKFDTTLREDADTLALEWLSGAVDSENRYADFTVPQQICFLERLIARSDEYAKRSPSETIDPAILRGMDTAYGIAKSRNSEIRSRWLQLAIRSSLDEHLADAKAMLKEQGRMKFTRPLYKELLQGEFGRAAAISTFREAGPMYHPICRKMVERDIAAAHGSPALSRADSASKDPPPPPSPHRATGAAGSAIAASSEGGLSSTTLAVAGAVLVVAVGAAFFFARRR